MTISFWAWLPLLSGLFIWLFRSGRRPSPRPVGWTPETIEDRITVEENGVVFPGKDDLEWQISHLERAIHENDRELQKLLDTLQQEFPATLQATVAQPVSPAESTPGSPSAMGAPLKAKQNSAFRMEDFDDRIDQETVAGNDSIASETLSRTVQSVSDHDTSLQLVPVQVAQPPVMSRREASNHWPAPRGRLLQLIRSRSSAALLPLLQGAASSVGSVRRWCSRGLLQFPSDLLSEKISTLFESGRIQPSNRYFPIIRRIPDPSQLRMMERFLASNRHRIRQMGITFALKLGRIELNDSLITAIQLQDQELLNRAQRAIEFEARIGSDPQELHRWITRIQGSLPGNQVFARLARLSHHPRSFVRAAILRALSEYDSPETFSLLEFSTRGDSEYEVRVAAIVGMGRFGLRGQGTLIGALQDKSSEVVLTAIKTLSDIRCADAIPLLEPLSRSSNPSIRFFAGHAIGQIRNAH